MKIIYTLFIAVFTTGVSFGQVSEMSESFSLGTQNAYVVEIPDADKKTTEKIWEKGLKKFGKVKRNKKAGEWYCLQCDVPGISTPTNVYFKVKEGKDQSTTYTYFDDGQGFVSSESNSTASAAITGALISMRNNVCTEVCTRALKKEEDVLKDNKKDQSKLEKKNKDLHKDIEDYRKKISEAEADIEKNLQAQEEAKMLIEKQGKEVSAAKDKLNNVGKN